MQNSWNAESGESVILSRQRTCLTQIVTRWRCSTLHHPLGSVRMLHFLVFFVPLHGLFFHQIHVVSCWIDHQSPVKWVKFWILTQLHSGYWHLYLSWYELVWINPIVFYGNPVTWRWILYSFSFSRWKVVSDSHWHWSGCPSFLRNN